MVKSDEVKRWAAEAGAVACGVAAARCVDAPAIATYRRWIAEGRHGQMEYLARYDQLRADPTLLLEGARTVVSCAFPYRLQQDCAIASYALGDDYHEVLRGRLNDIARRLTDKYGAACRVCVDTAPMLERYWAMKSGVGFIGRNHQIIVPGHGSAVLLGEILTTAEIEPDTPCASGCGDCMACVARCPGGALLSDGTFDSRRCLSYLTIEYRGELSDDIELHGRIYGCDECQLCCPHNRCAPCAGLLPQLTPRPEVLRLTASDVAAMDHDAYCSTFRHSAIRRAKLPQLHRNATLARKSGDQRE